MTGAIVGDIIGSAYEFSGQKRYDFEMLPQGSRFTDDTVMNPTFFHGRNVCPITSESGQRDYYANLNYWRLCYQNSNQLIAPTREEALEYIRLKAEADRLIFCDDKESRRKYRRLKLYDTRYDWRPRKTEYNGLVGLVSPTGERLLPECFGDVFTQFDAINSNPCIIPVSDGEAWALASLSGQPILLTEFRYNAIIPERHERRLFFIKDKETMKWGAMSVTAPIIKCRGRYGVGLVGLKTVMPPVADEIYEDELMTECEPTIFFMTRRGDKIGILTDFGYSDIAYDSYEVDNTKCSFRLIRSDRKRARRADYWHPDGKGLYVNMMRTQRAKK